MNMAYSSLLMKQRRTIALGALALLFFAIVFPEYVHIVILVFCMVGGSLTCYCTLSPHTLVPNLLIGHARKKKEITQDDELTLLKKKCPVCGKEKCSRHRPELNIVALQPWTNVKIPGKVDIALEEFLNLVLKDFIYTWYRDLNGDEAFVDELRASLKFIVCVLLRRLQKVDIPNAILHQILKTAIRHLHFYLQVKECAISNSDLERALLDMYGKDLHVANRNRRAELDYLKSFSEKVFPYILPVQSLKCKGLCVLLREILAGAILLPAMDVLADPDIVNNLLLIFLEPSVSTDQLPPSTQVPILANFAQPLGKSNSSLHIGLNDILGHPETLLFPFMQFMKGEASVNVLQFYLTVDEFNDRILNPDLTKKQLAELHAEVVDLYNRYCEPNAVEKIKFDEDIVAEIKKICDGPPEGVRRLQTSTPLFRAHEHAYNLLETTFLPLFYQSDDYYRMVCGERLTTRLQRSQSSTSLTSKTGNNSGTSNSRCSNRKDNLTLSKLGNRIKGVFKAQTVEGKLDDVQNAEYASEDLDSDNYKMSRSDSFEDVVHSYRMSGEGPLKDLSAWRVTIPEVVVKPDPENPKKTLPFFAVEVRRVDVLENDFESSYWRVERRYAEFYVLEQKLVEFHGEFEYVQLPPKKSFGTKTKEFLESKAQSLELYLQKLLTLPTLKGSELLHSFLTQDYGFESGFLPDINFGKMVKSGAMKLVKERGQHLDPFLQSFLQSTENVKSKSSYHSHHRNLSNLSNTSYQLSRSSTSSSVSGYKMSDRDSDTVSISSEKMANALYENNANVDLNLSPDAPPTRKQRELADEVPVDGIYDTLIYLIEFLYRGPEMLLLFLLTVRILFRHTLDTFVDWYLGRKLDRVLNEHKITKIIHLLRDALFFDHDPPRSEEDKVKRKKKAILELKDYIPKAFVKAVGSNRFSAGTDVVFELFQHPKCNKQLSYMLIDQLLPLIFPELSSEDLHQFKISPS